MSNQYSTNNLLTDNRSLGYDWGIAHASIIVANKGLLNFYLITHKGKVIFCVENGEPLRLISKSGEDLTAKLSVNQFINRFKINNTGDYSIFFNPVTPASVRKLLPNAVYQKYKNFPFEDSSKFNRKYSYKR